MNVSRFTVNPFGENTYVLWDDDSREAAIVDPGVSNDRERQALEDFIEREHLRPVHLINTHMHIDHVLGNLWIRDKYGLKVEANPADDFLGNALLAQARTFGMRVQVAPHASEVPLRQGDRLYVGKEPIEILEVPGHSPGSIGRTDLAGGDHATLINSIRTRLLSLPDDTAVLPGHGPESTIGREKQYNPYLG